MLMVLRISLRLAKGIVLAGATTLAAPSLGGVQIARAAAVLAVMVL
jgi:hypothetical protein